MLNSKERENFLNQDVKQIKKPSLFFSLENLEEKDKGPEIKSYFGGVPYLSSEKEIHPCPECGQKLDFVMQLSMPKKHQKGRVMYSFYYCFQCAHQKKAGAFAINVYHNPSMERIREDIVFDPKFPKFDLQFYPAYEIPEWEYLEEAFPSFKQKLERMYGSRAMDVYEETEKRVREYYYDTGFKFKGYPETLLYDEIPDCPITGEKMEPFLSMESIPEIDLNWLGDESYMILFKSKKHDEFAIRIMEFMNEEGENIGPNVS